MTQFSSEINGVQYLAVPQVGCKGCVAVDDAIRCADMPDCGPKLGGKQHTVIWVERTPENTARHVAWLLENS